MKYLMRSALVALSLSLVAGPLMAANQSSIQVPTTGPHSATDFTENYLNPALMAVGTCNWGASPPANGPGNAPTFMQCWADTSLSPSVALRFYDGAQWAEQARLNISTHAWTFSGVKSQTFSTVAAMAAASIPAGVDIAITLGHDSPADHGGASYQRIAPSTPAAWRVQSLDGQWWGIADRIIAPEMFGCFTGTDCTNALASMATWINTFSGTGVTINNAPGADYKIWSASVPGPAMALTGIKGLTWNFNGSRISSDRVFNTGGQPQVIRIANSSGLIFNNPEWTETAWSGTLSPTDDAVFFYVVDGVGETSSRMIWNNLKTNGASGALMIVSTEIGRGFGFDVLNADISNTYYGLSFQQNGNNFFARGITCNNTGRCYFPWNVAHHDVEIVGNGGGPFNQNLLKVYGFPNMPDEKRALADIKLRYRNTGRINALSSESLVTLDMAQEVAPMTVSAAANVAGAVRLTVDSTASVSEGYKWCVAGVGGLSGINNTIFPVHIVSSTQIDLVGSTFSGSYTSGGYLRVPASLRDITIHLDVDDTNGNGQPPALLTFKHNFDGSTDTSVDCYAIENVSLSGSLKGYGGGIVAIDLFNNDAVSTGSWVNETLRNIAIRDLTIPTGYVLIDATNVQANLEFKNIVGAGTPFTVTGAGSNVRIQNVSVASGLPDHVAVVPSTAPASQWAYGLNGAGAIAYSQINFSDLAGSLACSQAPALTGDVTKASGSCATTLATAQSGAHTWALAQTFTVAPVFTDAPGSRTALGLGTMATVSSTAGGDLSGTFPNPTINNAPVIAKILTGFASAAGTVSAADSILTALQKIDGNVALKAPLNSPGFTGTPTAATAAVDTNTTQVATTAMVLGQAASATPLAPGTAAVGTSPRYARADHVHPAVTVTPQGRLTLVTGTPVMISTVTGQTTVFYTPDIGNSVPIYDGTNLVPTTFAEVSQATTDATKSPAAVANNSNYDVFCWIDSGTNRCTRGPAWSGDNARGYTLTRVNGILLNTSSITNGPAASRGTYVGTIRSNGTATIDFQFGALAAGGTAGSFGVWNMYNRATIASSSQDTTDSYNVSAIGIANSSTGMRSSFVVGQIEDGFSSSYNVTAVAGASGAAQAGVSLNSTTAFSGSIGYLSASSTGSISGFFSALPLLGFNYTSAMEGVSAGTTAFKGDNGDPTHIQNGHTFVGRF